MLVWEADPTYADVDMIHIVIIDIVIIKIVIMTLVRDADPTWLTVLSSSSYIIVHRHHPDHDCDCHHDTRVGG